MKFGNFSVKNFYEIVNFFVSHQWSPFSILRPRVAYYSELQKYYQRHRLSGTVGPLIRKFDACICMTYVIVQLTRWDHDVDAYYGGP